MMNMATKKETSQGDEQPKDYFAALIEEMIVSGELDRYRSLDDQWGKVLERMVRLDYALFNTDGVTMEALLKKQARRIFEARDGMKYSSKERPSLEKLQRMLAEEYDLIASYEADPNSDWFDLWDEQLVLYKRYKVDQYFVGVDKTDGTFGLTVELLQKVLEEMGLAEEVEVKIHEFHYSTGTWSRPEYIGLARIFTEEREVYLSLVRLTNQRWLEFARGV